MRLVMSQQGLLQGRHGSGEGTIRNATSASAQDSTPLKELNLHTQGL